MPLYMSKDRSTGAVRHFEAPNNRAVLLHLAAEMFDVALVKFETIAETAPVVRPPTDDAETIMLGNRVVVRNENAAGPAQPPAPATRPGRPRKVALPVPAEREAAIAGADEPDPAIAASAPSEASEGLLSAEGERVAGRKKSLFDKMSDIARKESPAPANAPVGGEGAVDPQTAPENASVAGFDAAEQQEGADQQKEEPAPSETDGEDPPARPEPMFEE